MSFAFLSMSSMIEPLAESLVHFLWQGTALGAMAALGLYRLRQSRPEFRYYWACFILTLMAAAPAATFYHLANRPEGLPPMEFSSVLSALPIGQAIPSLAGANTGWRAILVSVWFAGFLFFALRLLAGWSVSSRWRRAARGAVPDLWRIRMDGLRVRMGIGRAVRLASTPRIDTPAVVGWLRPVILMPMSAFGISPEQLEMLLAHELAHVRRHDALVNFAQRVVEAILFYHPAIWWLSGRIREEREHCCDAAAVALCGNAALYARTLVELEERRAAAPSLALAATGGNLASRIRRVLGLRDEASDPWTPVALTAITLGLLAMNNWPALPVIAETQVRIAEDLEELLASAYAEIDSEAAPRPGRLDRRPFRVVTAARRDQVRFHLVPVVAPTPAFLLDPQEAPPAPPIPPAPPAVASPAVPPMPPAPPAPPMPPKKFAKEKHSWAMFGERDGSINLRDDAIFFVHEGKHYVSRDPELLKQARSLLEPLRGFGAKQRELAREQSNAAREKMRSFMQDDWRREMERLQSQLRAAISRREFKDIEGATKEIEKKAKELEKQMEKSSEDLKLKMKAFDTDMGRFGKNMELLGEEMKRSGAEAKSKLNELLREAIRSGKARLESF